MNGQQRDSGGNSKQNYSKINLIKSIVELKDYRGHKRILFLRPFSNTYMGYLGTEFFGYTMPEGNTKYWLMDPEEAVDYYLDNIPFKYPSLEYDTFYSKPMYRPFVTALKFKLDKSNGNKTKI
jgi:hypothetical protein